MQLTFLNIKKTEKFFGVVDRCIGPITVKTDDGRYEDIRNNSLIHKLLVEAGVHGCISQLKIHVEADRDISEMYRFMLEN